MYHEAKLSPPERQAAARATRFFATAFRGHATYDRIETASLDEAIRRAPELYEDRGVMIYAVDDKGCHAMLGSWRPDHE